MEKIGSIIGRVIGGNGSSLKTNSGSDELLKDFRDNGDIDCLWFRIVDEKLRAHSYVEHVRRSVLCIRVDSSCYLAEIRMKKGEILSKLKAAGWDITNIECRI
ncbi:MAG: DUF721 domain-containing protein [Candidatus Omnitrophica bacterium]|nr:DUF721 domain-containing protein [Candidatus Omnitrophota bacterium]